MLVKIKAIYLIPVGKVKQGLLTYLSNQIEQIFLLSVKIGKVFPYPDYAYNERRGQYKSDLILRKLQKLDIEGAEKILGVVDLDLYTSGLNFVFGLASIGGKAALIALPRLRQKFYGLPEDEKLYHSRASKEAVHELGHTFGLSHCQDAKCVMHFSNSLADTDYKGKEFCEECLDKLPFKERKG
jgi:archaemetzincin